MTGKLDIDRCLRGMRKLDIRGTSRDSVIADAIKLIQADPVGALRREYLGVKNYAGFGDQREDHEYGMGPKHGSIVFRIGRTDFGQKPGVALDADAIYLLEAYRDTPPTRWEEYGQQTVFLSLCDVIRRIGVAEAAVEKLRTALSLVSVDSHEEVAALT